MGPRLRGRDEQTQQTEPPTSPTVEPDESLRPTANEPLFPLPEMDLELREGLERDDS
jgi:hypothetical protein